MITLKLDLILYTVFANLISILQRSLVSSVLKYWLRSRCFISSSAAEENDAELKIDGRMTERSIGDEQWPGMTTFWELDNSGQWLRRLPVIGDESGGGIHGRRKLEADQKQWSLAIATVAKPKENALTTDCHSKRVEWFERHLLRHHRPQWTFVYDFEFDEIQMQSNFFALCQYCMIVDLVRLNCIET